MYAYVYVCCVHIYMQRKNSKVIYQTIIHGSFWWQIHFIFLFYAFLCFLTFLQIIHNIFVIRKIRTMKRKQQQLLFKTLHQEIG